MSADFRGTWTPIEQLKGDGVSSVLVCREGHPTSTMQVMAIEDVLITMCGMTTYKNATHYMELPLGKE